MTTGRINQVTVHTVLAPEGRVSLVGTSAPFTTGISSLVLFHPLHDPDTFPNTGTPISVNPQTSLVSDSHTFRVSSPRPETEMDTLVEDYTERRRQVNTPGRILE